nr:hypothetical protein CFP56_44034 [Quercus suber]
MMESMVEKTEVKKEEIPGRSLVDLVFSWSLKDVLNEDLHKHQDATNCTTFLIEENCSAAFAAISSRICSSDLNDSQKDAVLSCLVTRECNHQNNVKLIWGPLGTGKTKTVDVLLFSA